MLGMQISLWLNFENLRNLLFQVLFFKVRSNSKVRVETVFFFKKKMIPSFLPFLFFPPALSTHPRLLVLSQTVDYFVCVFSLIVGTYSGRGREKFVRARGTGVCCEIPFSEMS